MPAALTRIEHATAYVMGIGLPLLEALRRRHDCGQLPGEFLRREDDVRRAIAPAVLQVMEQAAVFEP